MTLDPSIRVGDLFDLKDGSFSVVQNNLLIAYLSLKGVKGSVSIAIFNRIVSGVYFDVLKEKTEDGDVISERSGTIWSEPATVDDIVYDLYPYFEDENTYKSTRNNLQKIINDVVDQRLFYRFGKNNFYAYTYEKNFVSWKHLFDGKSYVYPHTLKKLLNSEADLWTLFLRSLKEGDEKPIFTLEEFFRHFALFVDGIIGELPPSVAIRFSRFDKSGKYARLFLDDCKSVAASIGDYEGFVDDGSCKMNRMPASLADKFRDIIPKDELPGYTPPKAKSSRGAVFRNRKNMEKFSGAYQLEDGALKISEDPTHLMTYFERRFKEFSGIGHDFAIFKSVSLEILSSKELFDLLTENQKDEPFLKDWIRWYIRNYKDKILQDNSVIRGLLKSYFGFMKTKIGGTKVPHSTIFDEMKMEFKQSFDIETLCRKHGVFDVYNFIFVVEGEAEAVKHFDHFYDYVNGLGLLEKKDVVIAITRSTFHEKFPDFGYLMDKEHSVVKRLQKLAVEFASSLKIVPAHIMDREHYDFKEKIKYEYARRKAPSTQQTS